MTGTVSGTVSGAVIVKVQTAQTASSDDTDHAEVLNLLQTYRAIF